VRLGVILEHYRGRNDIRDLLDVLSQRCEVVLFGTAEKLAEAPDTIQKVEFRQVSSWLHRLWRQAFNLCGTVPESRYNYLITESFKLAALPASRRRLAMTRLRVRLAMPNLITFDFFLDRLKSADRTSLDSIDRFLVITELTSPEFLARLLAERRRVDAYVYSWDHPCKHARVSKRIDRWFVWHEGIREDMVQLQGVAASRVNVIGATQLAYVRDYLMSTQSRAPILEGRYIYYGCGVGHPAMARQEARLIEALADALARVDPTMRLVVRPYPFLSELDAFKALRARENVTFDSAYLENRKDHSLSKDAIFSRLNLQEHAVAFIHCGTTMGLEGAYFETPVIFLAMTDLEYGVSESELMHIAKFIGQYHNEKYMILQGFPNVVRSVKDLEPVLAGVLSGPRNFLDYNRAIASRMTLRTMTEIADSILSTEAPGPCP
jgi:hypothetical protein